MGSILHFAKIWIAIQDPAVKPIYIVFEKRRR